MKKYYIYDTTITPQKYVTFSTIPELIIYLERVLLRFRNETRTQFMQHLVELGHGADDRDGRLFVHTLSEIFNIGVIRNNTPIKCDIYNVDDFNKEEFGS